MRKLFLPILLTVSFSAFADEPPQPEIEECKIPIPGSLSDGNAAIEKMKNECLPKVKRIAECVSRTRLLSQSVLNFITKFRKPADPKAPLLVVASKDIDHFDMKASDLNIWRNFLSLEAQYNQSLDAVKTLAEKYKAIDAAASASSMQAQLVTLDHDYNETAKALNGLSENEYKLLIFIERVKLDLAESYESTKNEALWINGDACKDAKPFADVSAAVLQIQGALIAFSEDTDRVYQNIMSAKTARQNLVNYTYTAIRSRIEDFYSARLVDELSTLGGKLDTVLRANRLSAKFENWYNWSIYEQDRDKILTTYQQFEAARHILAGDLMSAKDFRDQMLAVTDAFPDTGEFYLNRMNSVVKNLEGQLQRLETKGWQGYLATQKSVATRLVGTASVPADCKALYQGFLDQAGSVDTLEKYRVSEKIYMGAVIGCTRK